VRVWLSGLEDVKDGEVEVSRKREMLKHHVGRASDSRELCKDVRCSISKRKESDPGNVGRQIKAVTDHLRGEESVRTEQESEFFPEQKGLCDGQKDGTDVRTTESMWR